MKKPTGKLTCSDIIKCIQSILNIETSTICYPLFAHLLHGVPNQVTTRTMKSGWLTLMQLEETRSGKAACWVSKRPTGG